MRSAQETGSIPAAWNAMALAGLLWLGTGLNGCAGGPPPLADVARQGGPEPAAPPAESTGEPARPEDVVLIQGWEESFAAGRSLENVEPDSVLFFRFQALLTHVDPGHFPAGGEFRQRAERLRVLVTEARDRAWLRWQVDLSPPPEPRVVHDPLAALTIKPESHPLVDQWIDYFTGRGREHFALWLWRSGAYRQPMEEILKHEGLPPDLIAMVFIESGFSLSARSRARAVGPWQFIQGTAKRYGLTVNRYRDERRDFILATRSAAGYLKDLHQLFGDWNLVLAAYNCGEGRVFRQISRQKTTDYWDLDLPRETRNYVPKFFAALTILSQPGKYGFSMETTPALTYEELALPGPVRVEDLAMNLGVGVEEVKSLNPAWLHNITPADGGPVTVRIPSGSAATFSVDSLKLVPLSEARNVGGTHRVKRGETLGGIARRYGVSVPSLARANGMSARSILRAGRVLKLPDLGR